MVKHYHQKTIISWACLTAVIILNIGNLILPATHSYNIYVSQSLFEQLGGADKIKRVTHKTIESSVADKRTALTFKKSDLDRLKRRLYIQICQLTGGPCVYKGPNMIKAHIGLKLTEVHFNALVEHLQDAMESENIAYTTQNKLLALLAPMKRDIIEK